MWCMFIYLFILLRSKRSLFNCNDDQRVYISLFCIQSVPNICLITHHVTKVSPPFLHVAVDPLGGAAGPNFQFQLRRAWTPRARALPAAMCCALLEKKKRRATEREGETSQKWRRVRRLSKACEPKWVRNTSAAVMFSECTGRSSPRRNGPCLRGFCCCCATAASWLLMLRAVCVHAVSMLAG